MATNTSCRTASSCVPCSENLVHGVGKVGDYAPRHCAILSAERDEQHAIRAKEVTGRTPRSRPGLTGFEVAHLDNFVTVCQARGIRSMHTSEVAHVDPPSIVVFNGATKHLDLLQKFRNVRLRHWHRIRPAVTKCAISPPNQERPKS